ncbi:hypothetical protein [Pseudoalteromonas luteoviolacea]|uniref:Uncharacterized protein n=1 Tax=Pseudoalteromonas luteoviolacea H33 TaxID=1365251 RepID=A0A167GHB5_9GAMM|nr:hypothetical protein [Pseudoalteromonas luteoviolacea]KZN55449.1 hypothetical protein N476_06895 [Pseudoalteromonas luteoviolacea H33]KZN74532.1 hypothetical protein N477_22405 [Pseudoalteromonas luteoviolacea H33-S]MBQ4878989.1 hypothetical protein [Pseudoalteromonas luteoviolacea]MBQ4908060.1 hypothetical protein [Pseudoalteromonas luteoviolacea]
MNVSDQVRTQGAYEIKHKPTSVQRSTSGSVSTSQEPDNRNEYLKFIDSASDEKLTQSIDAIKKYGPPTAMFRMEDILNSHNVEEMHGRVSRAISHFNQEAEQFHKEELAIIKRGEEEGKSAKEIMTDLVALRDKQSELFKMATSWGSKNLAHPDNYDKLLAETPDYINTYA